MISPLPENNELHLKIRPAKVEDAPEIAHLRIDTWRETYRGLLSQSFLDALDYVSMTAHWENIINSEGRQGFTLVVEVDGKIIGFALGGIERALDPVFQAEIYALYVLPAYQRCGAGKALVNAMVRDFISQGMHSMLVWVLKGNPSEAFYQRMWGVWIREKDVEIGDGLYREAAYGWDDLSKLPAGLR